MGQYWTRKNDQEDKDAGKTASPWAEHKVKGDRKYLCKESNSFELSMSEEEKENEPQLTEYEKYCRMMAQQQEDEMYETIMEDELKEYQPEGVFVRGH